MTEVTQMAPPGRAIDDLVDRYLSGWNAVDPTERMIIVEAVWEPDGRLVDHRSTATGTRA